MNPNEADHDAIQPYGQGIKAPAPSSAGDASEDPPAIAKERLTTFYGRELREPRPWPIGTILMAVVSAVGIGFAVQSASLHVLLAAGMMPLLIALALWWARPPALIVRFSEEGVSFAPADFHLPYERINRVFAPRRGNGKRRFPILLLCDGGYLTLAPSLAADSEELYQFLRSQPLGKQAIPSDVDPAFNRFLRQQTTLHGAEQITVYQPRRWHEKKVLRRSWRNKLGLRGALSFGLTGACGIAGFFLIGPPAMVALLILGIIALAISFFCLMGTMLDMSRTVVSKKFRTAILFISPSGLALSQAELKGELRWSEISKVKIGGNSGSFVLSSADLTPGVWIHVKGATIFVADIYQWPAEHIEWMIQHAGLG